IRDSVASRCLSDLVERGEVLSFPGRSSRSGSEFCDRPPPEHAYREPQASKKLRHHRAHATPLAALRGNAPLRNERGEYGGAVIHDWGVPLNTAEGAGWVSLAESRRRRRIPRSTKFEIDWYGSNRCRKAVPL